MGLQYFMGKNILRKFIVLEKKTLQITDMSSTGSLIRSNQETDHQTVKIIS